ncbi:hypothetical protein EV646_105418 [Kribbella antiqua]|uniref:Uncharacterized protein n=1 Tax=Kribbella antiqua TaxID=2512217 RepID=A0A4V2S4D9_9ACTN|nr:hypothetical protein [Kribbella antiqua]TCO47860.1 hypothetical protein EV646_105418 [Kribbella antiqua]
MSAPATEQPLRRVCVWLGEHLIIDHLSDPAKATWFEYAIQRRHAGLRVTNEPAEAEQ